MICGEIPDGFIICGWILKTNANSNYHDVVANWERKKTIGIIGNECFKFKVDLIIEEKNINDDIEIDWSLEIFCIHTDCLVEYKKKIIKYISIIISLIVIVIAKVTRNAIIIIPIFLKNTKILY